MKNGGKPLDYANQWIGLPPRGSEYFFKNYLFPFSANAPNDGCYHKFDLLIFFLAESNKFVFIKRTITVDIGLFEFRDISAFGA